MRDKCVFSQLVSSDQDVEGIVAYGIYKYSKHQKALTLSKAGKLQPEIDRQLDDFRNQFFDNDYEKNKVKNDATIILNGMREKARENLAAEHKIAIEQITKKHQDELEAYKKSEAKRQKAAIKKDRAQWIDKVEKTQLENQSIPAKILSFVWSGVPSATATFCLYVVFTVLLLIFFTNQDVKEAAFNDAVNKSKEFLRIGSSSSSSQSSRK